MINASVFALIEQKATDAEKTTCIETADGEVFRYADVLAITAAYASYLAEIGVEPGHRVAVQVEKSPQNLFLYLAVLRLGAIYLPLNVAYTLKELEYFLADAQPKVFVCGEHRLGEKQALARAQGVARVLVLRADGTGDFFNSRARNPVDYPTARKGDDDTALILYTSGTTGKPKGAMITHRNLVDNGKALVDHWRFTGADILLHALPLFHAHGLFISSHCALFSASQIFFVSKFDAESVVAYLDRCTVMMGVPTFYTRLLAQRQFNRARAKNVRVFISGSAPLPDRVSAQFLQRTGHRILERYGMTETGIIASNPYHGQRQVGCVGQALKGVAVRVCDDADREVKNNEIGSIQVTGPNIMKGYWRNAVKTRQQFTQDGWFRTGDLGSMGSDGTIRLAGRETDLIISGGYNVYPKEIELVIDGLPGIGESAVIGVPHDDFGEAVVAVVVASTDAPSEESMIAQLRNDLASYKVPKKIVFSTSLPRNAMGKVLKNELREKHRGLFLD